LTVRVFPIRHHGPGSARALGASLREWQPDIVLIEGPPEADPVLALAAAEEMRPPVALLAYLPGRPGVSSFYPFAGWSPEWIALRYALGAGVPVRMIDLPAGVMLEPAPDPDPDLDPDPDEDPATDATFAGDPIAALAAAGGYDDPERWWEDVVEHRLEGKPWDALIEAMTALRLDPTRPGTWRFPAGRQWGLEAQREASMRQHVRAAAKRYQRVAVVCGAWHAPALVDPGPAKPDATLLAGLPRTRATVTWVPWTSGRLSFDSGYGAGVSSPGWYEHLFLSPDRPVERWLARVASLLRAEQMDASPASVVEAVRLADALASLRGRPLAGLAECTDAAQSVLAHGHSEVLGLIERRLVVGDALGEVPPETPTVPLAADLADHQRRLRLKPDPAPRTLDLDLRKELDLNRSHLLHRLRLLDIGWGRPAEQIRGTGTFREEWALQWRPEFAVRIVEGSALGTTVAAAATAAAIGEAEASPGVAPVTALAERCLLAELGDALPAVMAVLDQRAALSSDVGDLMDALPPLVRMVRYGSVRRLEVGLLAPVIGALVARISVGLLPAVASTDDEAAKLAAHRISQVSAALATLDDRELREEWLAAVGQLSASDHAHGLLRGRATRLVLDAGRIDSQLAARRLSAALSIGEEPAHAAAWIEGFVSGSGQLLLHDRVLLPLIDEWLATVPEATFDDVLPLLRRAFSGFEVGERRSLADALRRRPGAGGGSGPDEAATQAGLEVGVDPERAAAVLPLLRLFLGPQATDRDGPA
jgi:hypothetical protein